MNIIVAVIGEKWESVFAQCSFESLKTWLTAGSDVILPQELKESIAGQIFPFSVHFFKRPSNGFQSFEEARQQIITEEYDGQRGLLILAAGTLSGQETPLPRLSRRFGEPRFVEWLPPKSAEDFPTEFNFHPPVHRPPVEPRHMVEPIGKLDFWTINSGNNYFQSLQKLSGVKSPPIWSQYGSKQPIFVYNTNEFDEELSVAAHDDYFILASGLLGLRMIVESRPSPAARCIVYDINPDQLKWIRFVLEKAGTIGDFESVIGEFSALTPSVSIRKPLPHELYNVRRQSEWYRKNHYQLAELASHLEWEFIECDLWTNPLVLLNKLRAFKRVFFMYLDLFMIWNVNDQKSWVENYAEIATSLEAVVLEQVGEEVTFLPGHRSKVFQMHPASPFA